MNKKPLYIIDAYALIYRYYFAFISRPLRNSRGENVSSLFGFAQTVTHLLNEEVVSTGSTTDGAIYVAAFDSKGPTFRHKMYPEYKATRQKAPDDLHAQVPWVEAFLNALKLPVLKAEGFEADDLIAALANKCKADGRQCYIVSGDKDLLQLVGDGVYELRPVKGFAGGSSQGGNYEKVDAEQVKAEWGVPPSGMLDLLSLIGDSSDNVPGVKGIGEKTATKLLTRYGSLDEIYKNIAAIEGSVGKKLAEGKDSAYLSKSLIALNTDAPVLSIEEIATQELDREAGVEVLLQYEVRQIASKLSSRGGAEARGSDKPSQQNPQDFPRPLRALRENKEIEYTEDLLQDPSVTIVGYDIKPFYKMTFEKGLPHWKCKIWDTMIASWLLDSDRGNYSTQTTKEVLEKRLLETNQLHIFTDIEMPLLPILAEMECRGVLLEPKELKTFGEELREELKNLETQVFRFVGHEFNLASPKQLQEVLFVERGLTPPKKTKTGYSTDAAVLEELSRVDPVPALIVRHRTAAKLMNTYIDTLPKQMDENGRVHTTFVQTGTATGRLSSRDPNLQNIPIRDEEGRRIRKAFCAGPGNLLVSADYSQIELVVLAHLSEDKNLIAAFESGKDVHARTASLIFGIDEDKVTHDMRRMAKTINFGVMYGMSAFRLSNELNISRADANKFISAYFDTYSGVFNYIERLIKETEERGWAETIMGRRRAIPAINSRNKTEKNAAERVAVNTPIQGSAADIVKLAMLKVDAALRRPVVEPVETTFHAKLLLQVHDELILEAPEEEAPALAVLVKQEMESAYRLRVPLKASVEIGPRWGDFH
ncbi:MAG: DNA polymerase I [Spirochaetaceae bacterium]|jgi:DNA polymerase-1|nr:DNA polymerase I [Spirochaetaceae bacterium]